jgi:hypothetical protein
MLYVAVSGKNAGKVYTEQEAIINLKKKLEKKEPTEPENKE